MSKLLKYVGQKNLNLSPVLDLTNSKVYCEPFSGSFQAGFNLIKNNSFDLKFIYNDLDSDLVSIWKCLIEDVNRFYNEYVKIREKILEATEIDDKIYILDCFLFDEDIFKRAASKYIYINNRSLKQGLTFNQLLNLVPKDIFIESYIDSSLLVIENMNYSDILLKYDSEETLFFIDPPYYIPNITDFYCMGSRYFYHKGLFEYIKQLKGKWILTYNDNSYISDLYSDYYIQKVNRMVYGVNYNELYISNFDISEVFDKIFDLVPLLDSTILKIEKMVVKKEVEPKNELFFEEVLDYGHKRDIVG